MSECEHKNRSSEPSSTNARQNYICKYAQMIYYPNTLTLYAGCGVYMLFEVPQIAVI